MASRDESVLYEEWEGEKKNEWLKSLMERFTQDKDEVIALLRMNVANLTKQLKNARGIPQPQPQPQSQPAGASQGNSDELRDALRRLNEEQQNSNVLRSQVQRLEQVVKTEQRRTSDLGQALTHARLHQPRVNPSPTRMTFEAGNEPLRPEELSGLKDAVKEANKTFDKYNAALQTLKAQRRRLSNDDPRRHKDAIHNLNADIARLNAQLKSEKDKYDEARQHLQDEQDKLTKRLERVPLSPPRSDDDCRKEIDRIEKAHEAKLQAILKEVGTKGFGALDRRIIARVQSLKARIAELEKKLAQQPQQAQDAGSSGDGASDILLQRRLKDALETIRVMGEDKRAYETRIQNLIRTSGNLQRDQNGRGAGPAAASVPDLEHRIHDLEQQVQDRQDQIDNLSAALDPGEVDHTVDRLNAKLKAERDNTARANNQARALQNQLDRYNQILQNRNATAEDDDQIDSVEDFMNSLNAAVTDLANDLVRRSDLAERYRGERDIAQKSLADCQEREHSRAGGVPGLHGNALGSIRNGAAVGGGLGDDGGFGGPSSAAQTTAMADLQRQLDDAVQLNQQRLASLAEAQKELADSRRQTADAQAALALRRAAGATDSGIDDSGLDVGSDTIVANPEARPQPPRKRMRGQTSPGTTTQGTESNDTNAGTRSQTTTSARNSRNAGATTTGAPTAGAPMPAPGIPFGPIIPPAVPIPAIPFAVPGPVIPPAIPGPIVPPAAAPAPRPPRMTAAEKKAWDLTQEGLKFFKNWPSDTRNFRRRRR